ncbi:MAG: hypothetical protein QXS29_10105 [Nitrososphaeria archaeon]
MELRPEFANDRNWRSVYSEFKTAGVIRDGNKEKHIPPPEHYIPIQTESTAVRVFITTRKNKKPTWKHGGFLAVGVVTGSGISNHYFVSSYRLFLDKLNIVVYPKFTSSYVLVYYPPKWFWDYGIDIDEYIGTGKPDLHAKVDTVAREFSQSLNRLETRAGRIQEDITRIISGLG